MNKKIQAGALAVFLLLLILLARMLFRQHFTSVADLQDYIQGFGPAAPLLLIAFQAFQVVVPVLPGYLGCAAGAVAFGSALGFWCNYLGICAGSVAAYFLARRYGADLVASLFSEEQYRKWSGRMERSRSYELFLFVATLLPLFPDDFLCYFSGLMKMDSRRSIGIILLGKPWCILMYSILFGCIG